MRYSLCKSLSLAAGSFLKRLSGLGCKLVNMGLINKVDMVCLSPVGYGVQLTFRALALRRSRLGNCGQISV